MPKAASSTARLAAHVEELRQARKDCRPIARLTVNDPDLTVAEAYEIQRLLVGKEERAGSKMGLTSAAKQLEMNVKTPIRGALLAADAVKNGGTVKRKKFIHPRAEPEIVFVLGKSLPKNATEKQILAAIESVHLGIEIIDSRYLYFKFSVPDVIADNTSAAGHVIGDQIPRPANKLGDLEVWIARNGERIHRAEAKAILGDPLRSLTALVKLAGGVPAGPVLAGAVTASCPFNEGDVVEVGCLRARASFRAV